MPITQVGAHRVYYDEYGEGRPLVLIPGLSNSRLVWWKQIEPLSKKYHVINMDNRDAGDSALGTGPYGVPDMADDVAGLIRNLNLGPAYVMGWSMGGFISQELTLRHPDLVERLILVATTAGGPDFIRASPEIEALLMPTGNEDLETRLRRIYPFFAAHGYMDSHPEDLNQIVSRETSKPMSMESYQRQLAAVMTWQGVGDRLKNIRVPVLVVHGDADPLIPYGNGQFLGQQIKTARLLTYPSIGHLPPIEAPERLNADVIEFLER